MQRTAKESAAKPYKTEINMKRCMVLGCGKRCNNHHSDKWYSINASTDKDPDHVASDLNKLSDNDFVKNGKNLMEYIKKKHPSVKDDDYKVFNAVLLENLTPRQVSIQNIKKFLAPESMLIIDGQERTWDEYLKANLNVQSYISVFDKTILLIGENPPSQDKFLPASTIVKTYLNNEKPNRELENAVNQVIEQIRTLRVNYPKLPLILISVMAHVNAYIEERKHRNPGTHYLSFLTRNVLNDDNYKKLPGELLEFIESFNVNGKSVEDVKQQIKKWKKEYPSSILPKSMLERTTLSQILETAGQAMEYYHKHSLALQQGEAPHKSPTP